jgi:hypothetical protein
MLFVIDNPNNFQTGVEIHGLHARSKNRFFIPIANRTMLKKMPILVVCAQQMIMIGNHLKMSYTGIF